MTRYLSAAGVFFAALAYLIPVAIGEAWLAAAYHCQRRKVIDDGFQRFMRRLKRSAATNDAAPQGLPADANSGRRDQGRAPEVAAPADAAPECDRIDGLCPHPMLCAKTAKKCR